MLLKKKKKILLSLLAVSLKSEASSGSENIHLLMVVPAYLSGWSSLPGTWLNKPHYPVNFFEALREIFGKYLIQIF